MRFRKKRNIGDYERVGSATAKEAEELRDLAKNLAEQVMAWMRKTHSHLPPTV